MSLHRGNPMISSINLKNDLFNELLPIIAAEALACKGNFCINDLKAFRTGVFE